MSGVILIGAGGHARVVREALRVMGEAVIGYAAPEAGAFGHLAWLGDDAVALARLEAGTAVALGVGGRPRRDDPGTEGRRSLFEAWQAAGAAFPAIVGAGVVRAGDLTLGDGVQLMAGAVIQPGVRLGDNVLMNTRAAVDHDCLIAAHAVVAPGAILCGGVEVGKGAWIGAGAVVLEGRKIGARAVVAAGAVVSHDVPAGGLAER